jgi:uncharacterized protein YehS (DUF1456 family)
MIHNDVLRRIRYIFNYDDFQMIDVFANADHVVSRDVVCAWLKPEDDETYLQISDHEMAIFLNGFINLKRGKREGEQPEPEDFLSNNMVLMKLRIALNLQSDEVLALLQDTGLTFSKHELTALFRKPGHKHYRKCEDQILRNFLKGLQAKLRDGAGTKPAAKSKTQSKPKVSPELRVRSEQTDEPKTVNTTTQTSVKNTVWGQKK